MAKTSVVKIDKLKVYITVGLYDDGSPGEVFLRIAKTGTILQGLFDAFAIMISHSLQYGVPLSEIVGTLENMRFEPMGMSDDPEIRDVTSFCDYLAKKLKQDYKEFL